jgi:hypothetical protein
MVAVKVTLVPAVGEDGLQMKFPEGGGIIV